MKLNPIAEKIPNRGDYLINKKDSNFVIRVETMVKHKQWKNKKANTIEAVYYVCNGKYIKPRILKGQSTSPIITVQHRTHREDYNEWIPFTKKEALIELL